MKTKLLSILIACFSLTANAQTYMYGTTYEGGANGLGTIYRVDQNGMNFQKMYDFNSNDGGEPLSGLTLANGKLYGFTSSGGPASNPGATTALGSFFEFDPINNSLTVIESLDDKSEIGFSINNSPLLANDGSLYFASQGVGLNNVSVLSKYDPVSSTVTVLDTLNSAEGFIATKLMQASNGHIYVTTANGNANSYGGVIRWNTISNQIEVLHSSQGPNFGGPHEYYNSKSQLLEGSDGSLYGLSYLGGYFTGMNDQGVGCFFKIELDGTGYETLHPFEQGVQNVGYLPYGGLVEKNGVIYGTTTEEGAINVNSGTIFSYTISNGTFAFIKILDLEGYRPKGTLTESPNGRFYFTTTGEPSINSGNLIEFNPINGDATQRFTFGGSNGVMPYNDELAIVDFSTLSINESSALLNSINIYPNPVKDILSVSLEKPGVIEVIKILDLKGSELFINKSKTTATDINTSFLSKGVYLLYIQTDLGSTTKKIIKE
jgi:uncharacterized repeat protein (TIGR03803 family)